ncbi:hypothetical protein V7O59_14155 [Methanolobus sp. ZRKC1]|uniref:hypothetical protein n=1 Tax=Methanolobus sp. ZRKC1 TaxID=3125781 RepID=UPI003248CBE5
MGETNISRKSGMKTYRDCDLKGRILRQVQLCGSQSPTARELFIAVQHHDFDSFLSSLHRLKKYGYLSTVPDSRPYRYQLTRKGIEHAREPYIYKIRKQQHLQERIRSILEDDERFSEEVEKEVRTRLSEIQTGTREAPIVETVTKEADDSALREELESKDRTIHELQAQIQHLKIHAANVPMKAATPKEKTPEQQQAENERIDRRKRLVKFYSGKYLDSQFFEHWKEIYPYKIKFKVWHSENSVELMSSSNKEHSRGHTLGKLPPMAIMDAKFHIIRVDDKGITIRGRGLPDGQANLRW